MTSCSLSIRPTPDRRLRSTCRDSQILEECCPQNRVLDSFSRSNYVTPAFIAKPRKQRIHPESFISIQRRFTHPYKHFIKAAPSHNASAIRGDGNQNGR